MRERRCHAKWCGGNGGYAAFSTFGKDLFTNIDHEEIQAVDIEIDVIQKLINVALIDPIGEPSKVDIRIDRQRKLAHDVYLGLPSDVAVCTELPIEIGDIKNIEIGNIEVLNA